MGEKKGKSGRQWDIFVLGVLVALLIGISLGYSLFASPPPASGYSFKDLVCSAYLYDVSARRLSGAPPYPCSVSCGVEPISYCPGEASIRLSLVRVAGPGMDTEQAVAFLDSLYVRMLKGEALPDLPPVSRYGGIEVNVPCATNILGSLAREGNLAVARRLEQCVRLVSQ